MGAGARSVKGEPHGTAQCLQLFGGAHWSGDGAAADLPDNLPGYLLAYLAYRGDWVARDTLAALLWPERPDSEARHNLRANLYRVRALLAGWSAAPALDAQKQRVRLTLPTDVAAFRFAIGRADWQRAVELRRGSLFGSCTFRGVPLLDEWARVERNALDDAWREATLAAAREAVASGSSARAARWLLQLLHEVPNDEAMQALLGFAAAAGCRDEALAAYREFCRALQGDIGVAPLPATVQLASALTATTHGTSPAPPLLRDPAVPRGLLQPARLVGRDTERFLLADPACALVVVTGEPGVGKTRLLEDALPAARWLACREGFEQVPFAPVIEWIDDQRDALPPLGPWQPDLARLVPALAAAEPRTPIDAALARPRLLEALAHLLETDGRALVFDDLQWADSATRELVLFLARRGRVPLRLALRRNEIGSPQQALLDGLAGGDNALLRVELEPLPPAAVLQLLAELSGTRDGPALFGAWLHRRTGGNPFFVLQTLRALFESGRLKTAADGWSSALDVITHDYSELEIPPRVADLIARRLRGVPDTARRVLNAVAVVGDARAVGPLAAVSALSAWQCAEALAELQAAGLLDAERFVHDQVRQAAYQATPPALRLVLHAAVAEHFAAVLPAARIAEHCWAAGDTARAVAATARAAQAARHAGLHADGLVLLARAFDRCADGAQRAQLHAATAQLAVELNDLEAAEQAARAALDEPALPADRALACVVLAAIRLQQGRHGDARDALDEAERSDPEQPALVVERSKLATLDGRVAGVVASLETRRDQLRKRPPDAELVKALTSLGAAYDELGDAARGLPLHQ